MKKVQKCSRCGNTHLKAMMVFGDVSKDGTIRNFQIVCDKCLTGKEVSKAIKRVR
jgi:hypothetical protein